MDLNLIPTLDPNPLPAPYWVFKILLLVTFSLHILAMNLLVGGAVLALIARKTSNQYGARIFADLSKKLPSFLPATITIGIAPLLFLQVIYGPYFYTSTIIMGWLWFSVLVLLTISYYGFYFASFKSTEIPEHAARVMLVSFLIILGVGFLHSNVATLAQSPARWATKYFADPTGFNLNLTDPTLIPRYLHFFVAAIAVGGLLLAFVGIANWQRDSAYGRAILTLGGKAFLLATMAQYLIGAWFLIALPREQRSFFMGENKFASAFLTLGFACGLAAIFIMFIALRKHDPRRPIYAATGFTAVVVLAMIVARDLLRDSYLKPYLQAQHFVVKTQWTVFPLFVALFTAGVVLWFFMLKRYFFPSADKTSSAAQSRI